MTSGRDDDALSWDGDDDPTAESAHAASASSAAPASPAALPEGWAAVGKDSDRVGRREQDGTVVAPDGTVTAPDGAVVSTPSAATRLSNAGLITVGVVGGIYILYAIGWLIGGLRLQGERAYLVTDVMYQGALWLATIAPILWFGTTLLLTRTAKAWIRIAWLVAGVLLLLPWPFILVGVVGR